VLMGFVDHLNIGRRERVPQLHFHAFAQTDHFLPLSAVCRQFGKSTGFNLAIILARGADHAILCHT
jgi:hypothetical protein